MNFSLYIAKRYLFSKSNNNAINIITGIASLGIIVGTLALFVVMSVFSGLKVFSLSFSNDFDPDLKVFPTKGKAINISVSQENRLKKVKDIAVYSKITEERVLFYFNGKEIVTYLKGVDSNFTKTNVVSKNLFNGEWLSPKTPEVVVGYGISEKLSLGLFDFNNPFEVYVPRKGKAIIESEAEAFNRSKLVPIGIYAISEDLDSKYVFCDLELAQKLLEYKPNEVSAIEIKIDSLADEEKVTENILSIFNEKVIVKNRAQQNATLYKMLNTENIAVYLIFSVLIIVINFFLRINEKVRFFLIILLALEQSSEDSVNSLSVLISSKAIPNDLQCWINLI